MVEAGSTSKKPKPILKRPSFDHSSLFASSSDSKLSPSHKQQLTKNDIRNAKEKNKMGKAKISDTSLKNPIKDDEAQALEASLPGQLKTAKKRLTLPVRHNRSKMHVNDAKRLSSPVGTETTNFKQDAKSGLKNSKI